MSKSQTIHELLEDFELSFEDIVNILKAMSNKIRLLTMITLLTGEKTFADLKEETKLKKTALSNHLTKLINSGLINKPDHNKYRLTSDGELFIRTIEYTYKQSEIKEKKVTKDIQKRQFSESFIESFFGNN